MYVCMYYPNGKNGLNLEDTYQLRQLWVKFSLDLLVIVLSDKEKQLAITVPHKGGIPKFRAGPEMPCSETEQSKYKITQQISSNQTKYNGES